MNSVNKESCKRKRFFANKLHEEIFITVFFATLVPMLLVTILLYYLIFQITAEQFGIPEAIAYNIIPAARQVTLILLITTPVAVVALMYLAHKLTHRLVGPFDRIIRELDDRIINNKKDPIIIRKKDKFVPLVDKINKLLAR